ncbi:MAG: class I SAM-dependent methyltransferase [Dehalococcoidia bacterium]
MPPVRPNPFDRGAADADEYDDWYASATGRRVLHAEQECVSTLLHGAPRPWLDLGTGSGRFGGAVQAEVGLDPAPDLLRIAARRMPAVVRGVGESLPFGEATFGAVLAVAVFEFLDDPIPVFREVGRVVRPGGRFVIGFFPREGPWAEAYRAQGCDSGSVFHGAVFFSPGDLGAIATATGFVVEGARATLFERPGSAHAEPAAAHADPRAGFVAIALRRQSEGTP